MTPCQGHRRAAPGEISRNQLQIPTLLAAIEEFRFDCCIGGARRDEEKARAKERFFSFRDAFGQWDPEESAPGIWNLYNARVNPGENMRVFPLSNWTEMDVWEYIRKEARGPDHLLQPQAPVRPPRRPVAARHRPPPAQGQRGSEGTRRSRPHHRRHHQHRLVESPGRHRGRHHRRNRRRPRHRARLPRR